MMILAHYYSKQLLICRFLLFRYLETTTTFFKKSTAKINFLQHQLFSVFQISVEPMKIHVSVLRYLYMSQFCSKTKKYIVLHHKYRWFYSGDKPSSLDSSSLTSIKRSSSQDGACVGWIAAWVTDWPICIWASAFPDFLKIRHASYQHILLRYNY